MKWKEKNKDRETLRIKIKNKRFYEANPNYSKDRTLKKKYGISLEDYILMYNSQNGLCKLCETFCPLSSKIFTEILNVDHCHTTGKIRGLLCHKCNKALGLLKDDVIVLEKAIKYLKE